MKKYWKNAKKTGKVREIRQSKKVGTMRIQRLKSHNLRGCHKWNRYGLSEVVTSFSTFGIIIPSSQFHGHTNRNGVCSLSENFEYSVYETADSTAIY